MQKDVIYIDVEDDITSIIGKVKAAEHKIVALVPPKRAGAIQSAVNLKLVLRAAESAGKKLVLITNNAALVALAGSASILVARNLQSRPEMAEVPALEVDDEDDIIDGSRITGKDKDADSTDDAVEEVIAGEGEDAKSLAPKRSREALGAAAVMKSKIKVPDFNRFRKKLFLIISGVVLLVGFLVWALIFAPSAKIIITARTTDSALSTKVTLGDSLTTSLKDGSIKTVTKTSKKAVSVPFTATGKKDVGEKATGTVKIVPDPSIIAPKILDGPVVVPAGTKVTSASGSIYLTNQALVFTVANWSTTKSGQSVGVTANASGAAYNGATGSASGPSGYTTTFTTPTSGGTDKTITIVQQSDVDAVADGVSSSSDADVAKQTLAKTFGADYVVLPDSFKQDAAAVKPAPAVGAESTDGKGAIAGEIVYSLTAVPKAELTVFLDAYFAQQIDGMTNQKVYSNGIGSVAFTNLNRGDTTLAANIATNGKYGPKISEQDIKTNAKGKQYGEIQSDIKDTAGVDSVDIKFSPFWVSAAPNDVNKIRVEFKVNGS